eukprot:TRINITY_DN4162_c0_g1_i1.p1 TRINITY_DN4162_c0_g1~~TRINITY_DN4162_c0_g1_i1.p1  ORF type:complete len:743 (+),score=247.57 TRINITY_DN4162_c0_g1_i1:123-2351(+)
MDSLKGWGSFMMDTVMDTVGDAANSAAEKIGNLKDTYGYMGTQFQLTRNRVVVKKLIAEGGFGFVFLVKDAVTERQWALKRILVQDRDRLEHVKNELQLMKSLSGHPNIVALDDYKINNQGSQTEVLLLMELCEGSLVDVFQNSNGNFKRLEEREIYNIFSQVCGAVERMHIMNPPVAHRDLKAENLLFSSNRRWKLCDFGSATTTTYRPDNERERSKAEEDINRNTTMMYRSPEMVDLYSRKPINEKVDIWALGCLLYKMAYMKDAFEAGSLAILNAKLDIPENPKQRYSDTFHNFMMYLLNVDPEARPDIFQVQEKLAEIRNTSYQRPAAAINSNTNFNTNNPRPSSAESRESQATNISSSNRAGFTTKKNAFDALDWSDTSSSSSAGSSSFGSGASNPGRGPSSNNLPRTASGSNSAKKQDDAFDLISMADHPPKTTSPPPIIISSTPSSSFSASASAVGGKQSTSNSASSEFDLLSWNAPTPQNSVNMVPDYNNPNFRPNNRPAIPTNSRLSHLRNDLPPRPSSAPSTGKPAAPQTDDLLNFDINFGGSASANTSPAPVHKSTSADIMSLFNSPTPTPSSHPVLPDFSAQFGSQNSSLFPNSSSSMQQQSINSNFFLPNSNSAPAPGRPNYNINLSSNSIFPQQQQQQQQQFSGLNFNQSMFPPPNNYNSPINRQQQTSSPNPSTPPPQQSKPAAVDPFSSLNIGISSSSSTSASSRAPMNSNSNTSSANSNSNFNFF